jgi:ribulose 1,5-bisphosphate carboxylase large subunit-like protein
MRDDYIEKTVSWYLLYTRLGFFYYVMPVASGGIHVWHASLVEILVMTLVYNLVVVF